MGIVDWLALVILAVGFVFSCGWSWWVVRHQARRR